MVPAMNELKKAAIIVVLLVMIIVSVSCERALIIEKQSDYHDSIADVERYLLGELGDYYMILEPDIDIDRKRIDISIIFLTSFINNEEKEKTLIEVMEETRSLFNRYLNENPNYYLNNDYLIVIEFYEAPEIDDIQIPYEEWGRISNQLSGSYYVEDSLCNINYHFMLDDLNDDSLTFNGVREVNVERFNDTDLVLDLIDRMPDLEIVNSSLDLIQYYSELRPDIQFV